MELWEYCPFTVSRYCRRIVSRLMAFTRDTSMPESWMSAGIRSTALRVVQDALAGFDRLVHENTAHRIGQGKGQLVRLRVAQG